MGGLPQSPGLIIAAPSSASGKTLVTLGLLRHFRNQGKSPSAFKTGPDYIDPVFLARACGHDAENLDVWAMRHETLGRVLARGSQGAGLVLCEGVMGLFDGALGGGGATADLAALTGWPVILVVDARHQGASAAALVRGFSTHRSDVTVAGVLFNRTGSAQHEALLRSALAQALPAMPVLGCLPLHHDLVLPSRHLGLVQAGEHDDLERFLDQAAAFVGAHVDTIALQRLAHPARLTMAAAAIPLLPLGQRIAIARDAAFTFAYPHLLADWRAQGAEISFFSPLADEAPIPGSDAVYLPGGYPELHAGRLARADHFRRSLRDMAEKGVFIYGECGGYMTLGETLQDAQGVTHAMAGLLALATSFKERRRQLGYRQMCLEADTTLGKRGALFRGHEFHYAVTQRADPRQALFRCFDATGTELGPSGMIAGTVCGSFMHLIDRV